MASKHDAEDDAAARIAELEAEVADLKQRLAQYGLARGCVASPSSVSNAEPVDQHQQTQASVKRPKLEPQPAQAKDAEAGEVRLAPLRKAYVLRLTICQPTSASFTWMGLRRSLARALR